jgi:FixJ family two-component response regulator
MTEEATVIIVDDDAEVRESLVGLLRSVGLQTRAHASVAEFLEQRRPPGPACLVLDIRLPDRSGLDLQRELARSNISVPIIFVTGYGDVPMTVQAMKGGAIEFLTKPFRDQEILEAIQQGLALDRARFDDEKAITVLRARFDSLSSREREVMVHVVRGRLNKQIAADIGISEITVKVHRSHMMHKMQASSLPELTRMADRLHIADKKAPGEASGE